MPLRVAVLTLSLALPAPTWAAQETDPPPLQRPSAVKTEPAATVPATPEAPAPAAPAPVEPAGPAPAAPAVAAPSQVSPGTGAAVRLSPRPGASRQPAGPGVGVYEAQPGAPAPASEGVPRYFRAPFAESLWPGLVGHDVLMVLGSGARECVTLTKKTPDALYFKHRKNGNQQAPLSAVTSIHEHSWECQTRTNEAPPAEWARSGAGAGLALSGIGAVMGGLYDASHPDPACELRDEEGVTCKKGVGGVPHFMYAILGVTTVTLGTPVVAIGGASTSRDLRVKGKIWARAAGWTLYSAATLLNVLWLTGFYGKVEALQVRGLTTGAGLLGLGGASFMAVDALLARQELIALRRQDAQVRTGAGRGLRIGAAPIGQGGRMSGMSFGIGGRF